MKAFNKLRRAAKGAGPITLQQDRPEIILVGDGGKDPAAEEYLELPAGSMATVAPKLSPNEEPNMQNAIKALAAVKLKKAAMGVVNSAPQYQTVGIGSSGSGVVNTKSLSVPKAAQTPAPAPVTPGMPTTPTTPTTPADPVTPLPPAAPYDPGVGVEPAPVSADITSSLSLIDSMRGMNSGAGESMFDRGARNILGAKEGMIKLRRAATGYTKQPILSPGGMVVGYQTVAAPTQQVGYPTPSAPSSNTGMTSYQRASLNQDQQTSSNNSAYQKAQLAQQKYATDAQRAIAQMNIDAQSQQLAQQLAYNRERLALDRMLGERQAMTDEARAKTDRERAVAEAQQLMMTRAGRQLNAPGGNTIPTLAPLVGRSIN